MTAARGTDKHLFDEMLATIAMTREQLAHAVGWFDGDSTAMVREAIHTAERAFAELDRCDAVMDAASETGHEIAGTLRGLLAAEAAADIPAQLSALASTAERVRRTTEIRAVLNRVLGREEADEHRPGPVTRLTRDELPELPSAYRADEEFDDLMGFAAREEELKPRLRAAHAQRLRQVADHLTDIVEQASRTGFAEEQSARASVEEAGRSYDLWLQCLTERHRDLGAEGADAE
ncbi:hypothetical protein [Streptomyces sp. NPDC048659]|uniref:hypothetical protein n=1 Tax=Streptomyces sp. NPDC048659 TaxID=3155489 RepID=UPI00341FA20F